MNRHKVKNSKYLSKTREIRLWNVKLNDSWNKRVFKQEDDKPFWNWENCGITSINFTLRTYFLHEMQGHTRCPTSIIIIVMTIIIIIIVITIVIIIIIIIITTLNIWKDVVNFVEFGRSSHIMEEKEESFSN